MPLKLLLSFLLLSTSVSSWSIDPFTIELYEISCKVCHETGVGDAPKSFAADAWEKRLAKGPEALLNNVIAGYKGMPPLGMCADCAKEDFVDLIAYISKEQP